MVVLRGCKVSTALTCFSRLGYLPLRFRGEVVVWVECVEVVAISGLTVRFNGEILCGSMGVGFAGNGVCKIVNTGNTKGSAFLGTVSNRLRPAGNSIMLKPNRHLSMLDRSRFG